MEVRLPLPVPCNCVYFWAWLYRVRLIGDACFVSGLARENSPLIPVCVSAEPEPLVISRHVVQSFP